MQHPQPLEVVGGVEGVETINSSDGILMLGKLDEGEPLEGFVWVSGKGHVVDLAKLLKHFSNHIVIEAFRQFS